MNTLRNFLYEHWLKLLIVAGVIVGGSYYFFVHSETTSTVVKPTTAVIERGALLISVSGSGQVEAANRVDLKPVAAGDSIVVRSVLVKNDQAVKKNQLIAVLDTKDAARDVENAALSLKSARVKEKQTEKLYPGRTVDDTRQRRLQSIAVHQAELTLAKANAKLQDYYIRAPFDGIVTGLTVSSGDTIAQTAILASVITREMKVAVTLNEVDAAKVKEGMSVSLTFSALPELTIPGTLATLDTIGTTTQGVVSYGADITLSQSDERLRPGMSVAADIEVMKKTNVLLAPNSALLSQNGKTTVKVVANASAKQSTTGNYEERTVTLGLTDEVFTEVLSGLVVGETIVTNPNVTSAALPGAATGQRSLLNTLMPGRNQGTRGSTPR